MQGITGNPLARRHLGDCAAELRQEIEAFHILPEPATDLAGYIRCRVRQDEGELVAAVPRQDVGLPEVALDRRRDRCNELVSDLVAILVVDAGEAVKVHHDQAHRLPGGNSVGELVHQTLVQEASVEQAGEIVGECTLTGLFSPLNQVRQEGARVVQTPRNDPEHLVHDLDGYLGPAAQKGREIRLMKAVDHGVVVGTTRCRPGCVLEDGHFPEEVARTELCNGDILTIFGAHARCHAPLDHNEE